MEDVKSNVRKNLLLSSTSNEVEIAAHFEISWQNLGMLFYPYFLIIRILDLSGYLKKLSGYPSLAKLSTNLEK